MLRESESGRSLKQEQEQETGKMGMRDKMKQEADRTVPAN